jgi:tripartite-type tricarboxylate transporter receptor subunit TctC
VPTLAELGLAGGQRGSVFGLFAPAGTPAAVIERLNAEVNKLLKDKDVLAKIDAADNLPTGGSAADFAKFIANESASNARIIKAANIRAE